MGYVYDYQPATKGKYWNLPEITINGLVLHSIGCPQPKAQVLVNNFNKSTCGASVHGFIEPDKYIETAPTRDKKRKAKKCYHVGGNWNASRIGIEMCEPSTITYTGGASFRDNNPTATRDYIERVTATAAEVFADLCIFHDIGVDMISTHAEAYKLGQGSNHGDPDHIWRHIGYSLAQFRKDVQYIINEKKGDVLANMTREEFNAILDEKLKGIAPTVYKFIEDVPEWGRPSVQKILDAGIMSGTGTENGKQVLNISADFLRTIVLLDRAGQFDTSEQPVVVTEAKK